MISLIDHHEQQFAIITAEITTEIGKLKLQPSSTIQVSHLTAKQNLERLFEEANETLEQVELETRQLPDQAAKNRCQTRLKAYRVELQRLDGDLKSALSPSQSTQSFSVMMSDEGDTDQRAQLLSGNAKIHEQNNKLSYGRRVIEETTQVGGQALEDLGNQREAIMSARERIRETDHILGKSSNVLTRMLIRAHSQKALLICLFVLGVITILVTFFLVISKRWSGSDDSTVFSQSTTVISEQLTTPSFASES